MTELERKIAGLPCWRGKVEPVPLKGGLTNLSFLVDDAGAKFVVRCGDDIAVHHVFRDRERAASIAAHEAGISPEVVHVEPGLMVLRFLDGRTFEEGDLKTNIERIVPLLKTCHREVGARIAGPPNFFWVFHVIRDYVRLIDADPAYTALADRLERAQSAMPIVFGHHDLLPGNLMDDGLRLWLIDWEYGGFGTAMFDLANLSANGAFGSREDEVLLNAYFDGRVADDIRRSFQAMKAASALREALWAMVSDIHLKRDGIDYKAHAREYLRRLEEVMAR